MTDPAVHEAIGLFAIDGVLVSVEPLVRGHIHDTFVSTWTASGGTRRYLHQRINDRVFQDVPALMHNIERVTRHLRDQAADSEDDLETLQLVPSRQGEPYLVRPDGPWRTYHFVDGAVSHDRPTDPEMAYEAAQAFGGFQARLIDLPVSELRETIPRFFDAPHRLEQLDDASEADPCGRAAGVVDELAFVDARRPEVPRIEDAVRGGRIPVRVVHGDTKLNNVLIDRASSRARCVVDLDTCMPGWSLYDFGDLVRFTAARSAEDEMDLDRAGVDVAMYEALRDGYLVHAAGFLTAEERALMPFAARLVTMTVGMRFLADHLAGDRYFKVHRPGHNLDRARVQFRMVEEMERALEG